MSAFKRKTTAEFNTEAVKKHGNKYDYSLVEYVSSKDKVKIICPEHGVFEMTPNSHLTGQGCKICSRLNSGVKISSATRRSDSQIKSEFMENFPNNEFEYLSSRRDSVNKVIVMLKCPIHGDFEIGLNAAIDSKAVSICPSCRVNSNKIGLSNFIERAKAVHGESYNYDKFVYLNNKTHGIVSCNSCGHEWNVRPDSHLYSKSGCPVCNKNKAVYTEAYYKAHGIENHNCSFYVVEFSNEHESFIKIGLSTSSVRHRFRGLHKIYNIREVLVVEKTFFEVYKIEQLLLKDFSSFSYSPIVNFKGHTECFSIEVKESILSNLTEMLGGNSVNCGDQLKLEDTTHA